MNWVGVFNEWYGKLVYWKPPKVDDVSLIKSLNSGEVEVPGFYFLSIQIPAPELVSLCIIELLANTVPRKCTQMLPRKYLDTHTLKTRLQF